MLMLDTVPFPELKLGDPYLLVQRDINWLAHPAQSISFESASCL
jgi:hypothetical protein